MIPEGERGLYADTSEYNLKLLVFCLFWGLAPFTFSYLLKNISHIPQISSYWEARMPSNASVHAAQWSRAAGISSFHSIPFYISSC